MRSRMRGPPNPTSPTRTLCKWVAAQALEHAGLTWETPDAHLDPARCGILIGTAMGGMHTFSTAVEDLTLKVLPGGDLRLRSLLGSCRVSVASVPRWRT